MQSRRLAVLTGHLAHGSTAGARVVPNCARSAACAGAGADEPGPSPGYNFVRV